MVEHNKRKKHHDKDKYYRLAKEQGYRSRAAFKLTQINKKLDSKHNIQNAKVVLDLCAAPGGWSQVASRTCSKESLIVSVDILPIRPIANNVITLIGDITTEKCKADISRELQGAPVNIVLHDGAPNVGSSYQKDAYEQNEIALHALKCATQHLISGGTFITKLYRSRDYMSYVWVCKQLFRSVQAVKPSASRSQSAEIFLVCTNYMAPDKIDARLLDPKHIFEAVEGDTSGGGNLGSSKKMNVFHKQYNQQKRPSREGYDMETMDASMRNIKPVNEFVEGKDPVHLLSQCTGFQFQCQECADETTSADTSCHCQFYLKHPLTTSEIKACVSDLKVLNKSDFKGLLTWRTKLRDALEDAQEQQDAKSDAESVESASSASDRDTMDSDEDEIQAEIEAMRQRRLREKKKVKKKERALAAKRRRRAALGMDLNALDVPEHDKIFSLATITSKGELEAAREVDLDKVTDEQLFGGSDGEEEQEAAAQEVESQGEEDDLNEDTGYSYRLDRELDEAYNRYLQGTKNGAAKSGTKMAKRSKKLQRQKAMEEAAQDQEMMLAGDEMIDRDTKTYAKLLQRGGDSDDDEEDSADDEDDGFHEMPLTPEEYAAKQKTAREGNPLIYRLPAEPTSVKTARWFSNPIFESIGTTAELASMPFKKASKKDSDEIDYDSDSDDIVEASNESKAEQKPPPKKKTKRKGDSVDEVAPEKLDADEVLALMPPKTDKQVRHERRKKALERQERKKARKARQAGETEVDFEVAAADDDSGAEDADDRLVGLSEKEKAKVLEARALIKAGLGSATEDSGTSTGFEVVSAAASDRARQGLLPVMDTRKYDSDHEHYDSDDYAQTLALGTMMLRRSKAKALVDASYNRYAWNDPEDLPDWFVDDENRHYRPQLPIPPELIAKMKAKQLAMSTKPIAKVAEARARKSKRAKAKLAAAKKKAETVANSSEMSEAMKLKAISKAMRGQDAKRPGKTYAVSKKGRGSVGAKGVKFVDKRMKNDKRSMDRSTKKRGGKRGGLTGSKRRRHHS